MTATTKTQLVFETECGEYRVVGKTFKECRAKACRLLSVDGPRALRFSEVGGSREFYKSLYDGQDYHVDASGRKHS